MINKLTFVAGMAFSAAVVFAYDSSSYVQNGLVAQWDGIDNAGAGEAHNASATKWVDLKGGYEFAITGVTVGEKHLYFSGATSSYGCLTGDNAYLAFHAGEKTVEICCAFEGTASSQVVLHGPAGTGVAYGKYVGSSINYVLIHNAVKSWCFAYPGITTTNTVAMPYKASNAILGTFYCNAMTKREVTDKTAYWGAFESADANAWIGKQASNANPFKGKIFAIRVYNRYLSGEELEQNLAVDRKRFLNQATFVVSDIPEQTYDGANPCCPVPSVSDYATKTLLTKDTDYELDYESNAAVGQGYVVINGKSAAFAGTTVKIPFAVRYSQALTRTCTWTNTDTSAAQVWTNATNWSDLNDDGIGDVPRPGDNVLIPAAANINFAGADIGNIRHTAGALTIDCSSGTMTNSGDIVTTGASVSFTAGNVYLTAGEHMYSNTCSITHVQGTYFKGLGGLTKRGLGSFYYSNSSYDAYLFKGALKIYEGTFQTQNFNTGSFNGPSEIIVDGVTARFHTQRFGQTSGMMTIRLRNKGVIYMSSPNAGSSWVRRLFIDDKQCAAGKWGYWNSTDVDYKSLLLITDRTDSRYLAVFEGPTSDAYEEGTGNIVWSGGTMHWTGKTSTAWGTASNWEEGHLPLPLDNIIINANAVNKCDPNYAYIHHLTNLSAVAVGGVYVYGDVVMKQSCSFYPQLKFFGDYDHVFDTGENTATFTWHSNLTQGFIAGEGRLIKRGSGTLKCTTGSAPFSFKGPLVIEDGKLELASGDNMTVCTNVTITGAGSSLKVVNAALNYNAAIVISNGGKLNLAGASIDQTVLTLTTDGWARSAKKYTGAGATGTKIPEYLSGTGVLTVRDGPTGFMVICM